MILESMLSRLHRSLLRGPALNCKPHNSRQRVDFTAFSRLGTTPTFSDLNELLSGKGKIEFAASIPPFKKPEYPESEWSDEQRSGSKSWDDQQRTLRKLTEIITDAKDYFNDHGEQALFLGFPLLSLPASGRDSDFRSSRILAPLAFVPLDLSVRKAGRPGVSLKATGEGADLLVANPALMTLLEQQTGEDSEALFTDENAEDPWREIVEILQFVFKTTGMDPVEFRPDSTLIPVPKSSDLPEEAAILHSAVVGLFPMSNPGLIRDTKWMLEEDALHGPIQSFLTRKTLDETSEEFLPDAEEIPVNDRSERRRDFSEEFYITHADPCQASAIHQAHEAPVLVVHGPPGTGKSQTIVNIIGNYLARGKRVLFVCDKRTALDVVKYRLDALGLGGLTGVIHDPQRDRRNFYMGLREILDGLAEVRTDPGAKKQLEITNERLNALHSELRESFALLHREDEFGESYHDLVGRWLKAQEAGGIILETLGEPDPSWTFSLDDVAKHHTDLGEILQRARDAELSANPWAAHAALDLEGWLQTSPASLDRTLVTWESLGETIDGFEVSEELSLPAGLSLSECAKDRESASALIHSLAKSTWPGIVEILRLDEQSGKQFQSNWEAIEAYLEKLEDPLDREIAITIRNSWPSLSEISTRLHSLKEWQKAQAKWTRIFAGSKKKAAQNAMLPLGLPSPDLESTNRALTFYEALKARLLITDSLASLNTAPEPDAEELPSIAIDAANTVKLRKLFAGSLASIANILAKVIIETPEKLGTLADDLATSSHRAMAIAELESILDAGELIDASGAELISNSLRGGEAAKDVLASWRRHLGKMETVLRLRHNLKRLPDSLRNASTTLTEYAELHTDEEAVAALEASAIRRHLGSVLERNPALAHIDTTRIDAAFEELNERLLEKQRLTQLVIADYWTELQRFRLLAKTGSRMNSLGASLRQRLLVRGKRALKLRQMVAAGIDTEDGDPLFDVCPVWMASADTVAQIFPRAPVFDAVIFDEASQCRLEEALPVLLRAKRVVIAGDPRQLPPTRFFESAVAESDVSDAETAEELHQQQMSETEDLLTAALNLDVHEAFLDVHYRSQNEALIGFSNQHFYSSRLQPIPGHPKNKATSAPIRLIAVNGVYVDQTNPEEAAAVVDLVADLLDSSAPPSIGVASFNLKQRTLINDLLDERASKNHEFAQRLEIARNRRGSDSFEGLFVKNLENVQGDERDHIIISTTFGCDADGKFRRNFGAVSRVGGERRLNVLVTRARCAIHLFTSIPRSEYAGGMVPKPGERITGRHLLYAYLRYAEQLEKLYNEYQEHLETLRGASQAESNLNDIEDPSPVAAAIGSVLASAHKAGNIVHWGNDGFCVDVAITHPQLPEDVTIGVLTDFNRFRKTPDPIDWERFRTLVFRSQGWELHRLWSPRLLRDTQGELGQLMDRHLQVMKGQITDFESSLD